MIEFKKRREEILLFTRYDIPILGGDLQLLRYCIHMRSEHVAHKNGVTFYTAALKHPKGGYANSSYGSMRYLYLHKTLGFGFGDSMVKKTFSQFSGEKSHKLYLT